MLGARRAAVATALIKTEGNIITHGETALAAPETMDTAPTQPPIALRAAHRQLLNNGEGKLWTGLLRMLKLTLHL